MEKYVRIAFVLAGLLVWVIIAPIAGALMEQISPDLDRMLIGSEFRVSSVIGLLAGVGTAIALWFNPKVNQWGRGIGSELRNVTWPNWPETRVSTIVVIVTTVVISLILALMDAVWGALSAVIYGI